MSFFYDYFSVVTAFPFGNSSLTTTKDLAWACLKASNMVIQIFQIRLWLEATENIFINSLAVLAFWRLLRYEKRGLGLQYFQLLRRDRERKKKITHPRFRCTYELCWMNSWPNLWGIQRGYVAQIWDFQHPRLPTLSQLERPNVSG